MAEEAEQNPILAQFMFITGSNVETATQYLELTNWSLDESVNIFMESDEGATDAASAVSASAVSESDSVRAPDAPKRQRLVGGDHHPVHDLFAAGRSSLNNEAVNLDPFRNFAAESSSFVEATNSNRTNNGEGKDDRGGHLHSLFQPPNDLVFRGSLQDAREAAKVDSKWLLVNIQDTQEFSSHMLNRDTWSDDVVQNVVASAFIFWQVHSNTSEGKRFCALHQVGDDARPYIGIIDPRTGQEIVRWFGFIDPQDLTMKLSDFCDQYSLESNTLPTRRGSKSSTTPALAESKGVVTSDTIDHQSEDAQLAAAIAASIMPEEEANEDPEISLPEEPSATNPNATRVQIRTPEGAKYVRRVLKQDPVALLFQYVRQEVPEARTKGFQLRMAYPPKPIENTSEMTIEESKLMNATLVLQWVR